MQPRRLLSEADRDHFLVAARVNATPATLAEQFHLTEAQARNQVAYLRRKGLLTPARVRYSPRLPKMKLGATTRACLSCGYDFPSTHIGNRICDSCKASELF